jgi:hypothetical protein
MGEFEGLGGLISYLIHVLISTWFTIHGCLFWSRSKWPVMCWSCCKFILECNNFLPSKIVSP